jgi:hypothetical protein
MIEIEEETDYKRTRCDWSELMPPAAEALYAWSRPNSHVPDNCIASLLHELSEIRGLNFSDL